MGVASRSVGFGLKMIRWLRDEVYHTHWNFACTESVKIKQEKAKGYHWGFNPGPKGEQAHALPLGWLYIH